MSFTNLQSMIAHYFSMPFLAFASLDALACFFKTQFINELHVVISYPFYCYKILYAVYFSKFIRCPLTFVPFR